MVARSTEEAILSTWRKVLRVAGLDRPARVRWRTLGDTFGLGRFVVSS
jgi:hypothetical protein